MAVEIIATYSGGGTLWNPGVEFQPGDALIWFLRLDTSADAPGARMAALADSGGTPITFSYVAHADWGTYDSTNYVATNWGNTVFNSEGDITTDQTIYVIFDQFTGFTAGEHYVKFTLPGSSGARVEAAHLLRGVTPDDPGAYIYYSQPASSYEKVYGDGGSVVLDHFPASVPLTGSSSIVYCLWRMNFSIGPPAGYSSVPGTKILEYTTYDPSDAPAFTSSMIAYVAGLTGAGTTIADPVEGGWSGSPLGTGYIMDAIVINGGDVVVPSGPTVYFADLIVFNAAAGVVVEY